jgi:hypothetical protein
VCCKYLDMVLCAVNCSCMKGTCTCDVVDPLGVRFHCQWCWVVMSGCGVILKLIPMCCSLCAAGLDLRWAGEASLSVNVDSLKISSEASGMVCGCVGVRVAQGWERWFCSPRAGSRPSLAPGAALAPV